MCLFTHEIFMSGRTNIGGKLIKDSSIDGDDLKDTIVINPRMNSDGGLVVMGSDGYLLSASADLKTISISGSLEVSGSTTLNAGEMTIDASELEISGALSLLNVGVLEIDAAGLQITGTLDVAGDIKGSITKLTDGSPFLLAGPGIQLHTGSSGAVSLSASLVISASSPLPTPTTAGRMMYDQNNLYIAIDANTWKKVGLSSI